MWQHGFSQLIDHDLDLLAFFGQTKIVELSPEAVVDLQLAVNGLIELEKLKTDLVGLLVFG
jgi:hypothetical protein